MYVRCNNNFLGPKKKKEKKIEETGLCKMLSLTNAYSSFIPNLVLERLVVFPQ